MRYTAAENSGKIQSFSVSDGAEINHTRIYGNEYACHFFLFFNRKNFRFCILKIRYFVRTYVYFYI